MDTKTVVKEGRALTPEEISSTDTARAREWQLPPITDNEKNKHLFVFIKDSAGEILAQGQLYPITNVQIINESFAIFEIGGIIANEKGKGYGKLLNQSIMEYLSEQKKSGIGFASERVRGFYQACGYTINSKLLSRFPNYPEFSGGKEDFVFYYDAGDHFWEKVLDNPQQTIFLPKWIYCAKTA